ncbi:MAG TPA: hypothetical protein VFL13_10305 [Candidatus Baltobacteraceae bacterium]|nr:hypothetical protein [Candidatus Baltobacteraceae bacterium]
MDDSSAHPTNLRPHRLAAELAALLKPGDAVLDFAAGSERNTAFLRQQGFHVDAISDGDAPLYRGTGRRYDAAVSTHGMLHGTPETIKAAAGEIAESLVPGAPFFATFASTNDPRFGKGERLGASTFAPQEGEEQGVPHTFFDETGVRDLLAERFSIAAMEEHGAEHIAGSVHWFVRARRR